MAEIGQTLHEARIRARIDISEMEARTKIRAKYLRALENEEWDLLPGDVFVKSFLKTYGDALGLDSRLLVDEFKRQYERPADHEAKPAPSRRDRDRSRAHEPRGPLLSPRALVAVVIVAIIVGLGVYGELTKNNSGMGGTNTPVANSGGNGNGHTGGKHGTTTTTTHTTTTSRTQTTSTNPPVTLQIVPTASVWICVERASGKALVPGVIYSAGETVPVATGHTLLVNLGNDHVDLKVNGKAYPITASGTPVGLKVTTAGVSTITSGPTCGQ
jgi:cytoskeleton protein RodZ